MEDKLLEDLVDSAGDMVSPKARRLIRRIIHQSQKQQELMKDLSTHIAGAIAAVGTYTLETRMWTAVDLILEEEYRRSLPREPRPPQERRVKPRPGIQLPSEDGEQP